MDQDAIEHLAGLARLNIGTGERKSLGVELSRILEFVAKLNEADASRVPEIPEHRAPNVVRPDEPGDGKTAEGRALLAQAPRSERGYVSVPPVFRRKTKRENPA